MPWCVGDKMSGISRNSDNSLLAKLFDPLVVPFVDRCVIPGVDSGFDSGVVSLLGSVLKSAFSSKLSLVEFGVSSVLLK